MKKHMSHFGICFKQKNIFYILSALFLTLPSTQTIKVIGQFFFQWDGLEKLGYEYAFQTYIYSLRPQAI